MRIHFRGLFAPAFAAALGAALTAGCGGGSDGGSITTIPSGQIGKTSSASAAGISATGTLSGGTLAITAQTDRSDTAQVWAVISTGTGHVSLAGSGKNWSGSAEVQGAANAVITADVFALDALGNQWGPARLQVRMGEFGAQPGVTGLVLNKENSSVVTGATVTIGSQTATTDAAGRFLITGLVAGSTLQGTVVKSGFQEATFTVVVSAETQQIASILLTPTPDLPPAWPVFP